MNPRTRPEVIAIAEKSQFDLPTPADLRQAARLNAVRIGPLTELGEQELGELAAKRERLEQALDSVPEAVLAWERQHHGRALGEIATLRKVAAIQQGRASPPSPWLPLTPLRRAVLGNERAQGLLVAADGWRGRAEHDYRLMERLAGLAGEEKTALIALDESVAKLEAAAEANAAANELELREMIAAAHSKAEAGEAASFGLTTPDGAPVKPPLDARRDLLGSRGAILKDHSNALAAELRKLDTDALQHLAGETSESWPERGFDGKVSGKLGRLELAGAKTLARKLDAEFRIGAGLQPEASRTIAANQGRRLGEIDAELAELRRDPANPDKAIASDPVRTLAHDASRQVLAERAAELALAEPATELDAGAELPGPGL